MKNLSKLLFLLIFIFLFSIRYLVSSVKASDDNPIPPRPIIPCDGTEDPEFNSLRPYKSHPCGKAPQSRFCGNKIIITESESKSHTFPDSNGGCDPFYPPSGVSWKWVNDKDYWIDMTDLELPILGNTQDIQNSQNPNDQLNDAQKMNEYASWYLNGVINRAEYGENKNTDSELINFSGPINKLMPSMILEAQRIETIRNAEPDLDVNLGSNNKQDEVESHNQIVVCARQFLPFIGHFTAKECYEGNGTKALGINLLNERVLRLKDWKEHLPPLPWEEKYINNEAKYKEDRCEWEGGLWIRIPFTDLFFCGPNPFNSNIWADLYPYIPLANTSDKQYPIPINTTTIQGSGGVVVTSKSWDVLEDGLPVLYYPHAIEVKELSDFLNKTYLTGDPSENVDTKTSEINSYNPTDPEQCRTINVRSNEGDNLFPIGGDGEHDIGVHVYFEVDQIPLVSCKPHYNQNTGELEHKGEYYGEVAIEIHTDPVQVPNADQIWKSTVSSETSTFRKIFPKVEKGAPVECIADIPGVSKVAYAPIEGTDEIGVKSLTNPEEKYDPLNAKLYFPHLGTVYEYFLKGIQTALRPKGYGEPIPNGIYCKPDDEEDPDTCPEVPDSEVPGKFLEDYKLNYLDLADRWSGSCPGAENNLAEECYNYVVTESLDKNVNPAFSLTMWLEESGSSNYCSGATQDFGINHPDVPEENIPEQLEVFLNMAQEKKCENVAGFYETMHGWLSRFQSYDGVCDSSDECGVTYTYGGTCNNWGGQKSTGGIIFVWEWVNETAGGCTEPGNTPIGKKFSIDWPTSMSCP